MAREWILNSAMNRFQLNFKRNVGAVSEEIRKCQPKSVQEWQDYYFANVRERGHIESLGRKLYIKITEVISAEVEEITEENCINYMMNLVIDRTFSDTCPFGSATRNFPFCFIDVLFPCTMPLIPACFLYNI